MALVGVANETVRIIEQGEYVAPSGRTVSVREAVERAVRDSVLYRPSDFERLEGPSSAGGSVRIEVTPEKTGAASRRLIEHEGVEDVLALNFASARNPGGGFLRGAKAQEEDLARCSALYACITPHREYYEVNRAETTLLYTDHLIYSPRVPFFRDEKLRLLERPFHVSIITAPAPNAGQVLRRDPGMRPRIREVLHARALKVLQVAAERGHRTLVLGAWGCGVFANNPAEAAEGFAAALSVLSGAFDRVVFAVYERGGDGPNLRAFRERFGADTPCR